MSNSIIKQYAREAKNRMLRIGDVPTFFGVLPLRRYDALLKYVSDKALLCRICSIIESGNDTKTIACLIEREKFDQMNIEQQQRYVFRLANAYNGVKKLYAEMEMYRKS